MDAQHSDCKKMFNLNYPLDAKYSFDNMISNHNIMLHNTIKRDSNNILWLGYKRVYKIYFVTMKTAFSSLIFIHSISEKNSVMKTFSFQKRK